MVKRRTAIKTIFAVSTFASLATFTPLGKFLTPKSTSELPKQKLANIEDIEIGGQLFVVYPKTGDPNKDSDPFRQFILVRVDENNVVGYSRVCIHLWCLISLSNSQKDVIQCPCHGSLYKVDTGKAFAGPASLQPNNTLPRLKLEIDENGDIYASGVEGVIGYGR